MTNETDEATVYETPKSNLDTEDPQTSIVRQLFKEQSYVAATIGAIIGLLPGLLITFAITTESAGFILILMLLLPGAITALSVKFCGRAFEARARLLPSALTFFVLSAVYWFAGFNPLLIGIAFINAVIVMGFSRRPLTYEQEKALYAYRIGKVKL